jgi:hypothetical protein
VGGFTCGCFAQFNSRRDTVGQRTGIGHPWYLCMLYLHGVLSCLVLMYLPREKFLASIERCVEIGIANRNKNKNNLNNFNRYDLLKFLWGCPRNGRWTRSNIAAHQFSFLHNSNMPCPTALLLTVTCHNNHDSRSLCCGCADGEIGSCIADREHASHHPFLIRCCSTSFFVPCMRLHNFPIVGVWC